MRKLSLCSLLLLVGAPVAAQDTPQRVHDLGALAEGVSPARYTDDAGAPYARIWPRLPLATSGFDEYRYPILMRCRSAARGATLRALIAESWSGSGDAVDAEFDWPRRLRLAAPAAVHARVRETIAALEWCQRQQVELTFTFLPDGVVGADAHAVLDPVATGRLLARAKPTAVQRSVFGLDEPHVVESGRAHTLAIDFGVEVAQKAEIADPRAVAVFEGVRAGVHATAMADGRVLIRLCVTESELERPIGILRLRGKELGNLQRPLLHSQIALAAAAVPEGGSLIIGGQGGPHGAVLVTVPRRPPADGGLDVGDLVALPLGDLLEQPWRVRPDAALDPDRFEAGERQFPDEDERPSIDVDAALAPWLARAGATDMPYRLYGNRLLVRAGKETRDALLAALRDRAQNLRTVSIEIRLGELDAGEAAELARRDLAAEQIVERLPVRGRVATLPGSTFRIVEGAETTYVSDYDAKIAQDASISDPEIRTGFVGHSIDGVVHRTAGGALRCAGRFAFAADGEPVSFDIDNPQIGDLSTAAPRIVHESFAATLRPGEWRISGPHRLPGSDRALVFALRAH